MNESRYSRRYCLGAMHSFLLYALPRSWHCWGVARGCALFYSGSWYIGQPARGLDQEQRREGVYKHTIEESEAEIHTGSREKTGNCDGGEDGHARMFCCPVPGSERGTRRTPRPGLLASPASLASKNRCAHL
jgi:hypothetical protein